MENVIRLIRRIRKKTRESSPFRIHFLNKRSCDYMYREIFVRNIYYFKSLNPDPLIIDCGSNIGLSVLFFKKLYPQSRIMAFEPSPAAFEVLKKNIKENNIINVECFNVAVSDKNERTKLYYGSTAGGPLSQSLESARGGKESIVIDTVELAKYVKEPVDLLKMDIEGSEMKAMKNLLENDKIKFIRQILLEYHHHIHPNEDNLSLMLKILEDSGFGYQVYSGPRRFKINRHFQDIFIRAYKKGAFNFEVY